MEQADSTDTNINSPIQEKIQKKIRRDICDLIEYRSGCATSYLEGVVNCVSCCDWGIINLNMQIITLFIRYGWRIPLL
jgi:hypothetical protein